MAKLRETYHITHQGFKMLVMVGRVDGAKTLVVDLTGSDKTRAQCARIQATHRKAGIPKNFFVNTADLVERAN